MYINANQARDKKTKKSTLEYITLLNKTVIFQSSKYQIFVTQSLCKTEYIAAFEVIKKAVWINCFLEKLYQTRIYLIPLYCNNQEAITLVKNHKNYQQKKYIDMRYYYI